MESNMECNLEPWNMFTNDFVAEETDEILTDEMVAQFQTPDADQAEVKEEPEDVPDDEVAAVVGNNIDDDDDDDAIFNFGLEPQVNITETSTAPAAVKAELQCVQHEDISQSNYEQPINYERAVVYICPACGSEFDAQDTWKRHMNSVHNFNTRRGLNFVQVDKLYHECLECHKRIAMHAMENLLKHKFTHLPYRCTKCKVCLRQYKYRQDLMVHLRMTHRDDLLKMDQSPVRKLPVANRTTIGSSNNKHGTSSARLEIKDIKENAFDIFDNTFDGIEVKNELMEPDDNDIDALAEQSSNSFVLPSFLEDALSASSSHASERQGTTGGGGGATVGAAGGSSSDEEICEKYIQYICPQCATEYGTQTQWRQHIEVVHDFGTRTGLNFREVNGKQHAQCLECNKIIFVNVIRNLQLHKFGHLPNKSWLRCKLCFRACVGYREIIKHLTKQHRLGAEYDGAEESEENDNTSGAAGDDDDDGTADQLLIEPTGKDEGVRDAFEPQIDYLCPQCGKEFTDKKLWRKHIVKAHQLTDLNVLNFKVINERQVMCLECDKVITNAYGVQNAQQHRITHMPYKAFIRCRLCAKSYTDRKGLVKHLRSVHRYGGTRISIGMSMGLGETSRSFTDASPLPIRQMPPTLSSTAKRYKSSKRQKEIVKHADVTYEIQYLDEDEDTIMDDAPVPELSFSSSFAQLSRLKCPDCGSIFPTQQALKVHMNEEHEFLDFNNLKPLPEKPKPTSSQQQQERSSTRDYSRHNSIDNTTSNSQAMQEEQSNDTDELLLVPTGDEELSFSSSTNTGMQGGIHCIERNFCYLCPACGVEFKAQIDWRRHINESHGFDKRSALNFRAVDKFRFQCTECNDIVSSAKLKGLQDHKFRHLPYKLYIKCLLCSTCYNHKPNMVSHLKMRHNIVDTRSPQSSERDDYDYLGGTHASPRHMSLASMGSSPNISSSATLSNKPPGLKTVEDCISFHNAVDHNCITYFCPQCNENFDTHVFWRKHIVEEHNLNSRQGLNFRQIDEHHYLCLQCYKRVTVTHTKGAIGQLQSHKFRHLPYKSFKCLACNGEFVRKQMFFKHLNRATNCCEQNPDYVGTRTATANDSKQMQAARADAAHERQLKHNSSSSAAATSVNDSVIIEQGSFYVLCPQCGKEFDMWRPWREHINIEHSLGKRETLKFKKLSPTLNQCLECREHVSGNKLRDLQIHKFKHLPFGSFIQCRYCSAAYQHIRNMKNHLMQKHPNAVLYTEKSNDEYGKMEETYGEEEETPTLADGDGDAEVEGEAEVEPEGDGNSNSNEPNDDDEEQQPQEDEEEEEEVEEIEEVEEPDEQFLLG